MSTTQAAVPLKPVSARLPLGQYIADLWHRRYFVVARGKSLAFSQHQGMLLGNLWLLFAPVLDGLVYFFIFGILMPSHSRPGEFFAYLVVGIFLFSFTARCLNGGANVIKTSEGLIRGFQFPRAALPLAIVSREVLGLIPTMVAMFGLLILVPPFHLPLWTWLLFPFVVALQTLFNVGLTLIVSRIGSQFPDSRHLVPYLARVWMYMSCVMLTIATFNRHGGAIAFLANANPMFVYLDSARMLLIGGRIPPMGHWLQMLGWAIIPTVLGFIYFWQKEVEYGRQQ